MKNFYVLDTFDSRIVLFVDDLEFQNFKENLSEAGMNPKAKLVNDYFSAIKFVTDAKFKYSTSYFMIGRNNKVFGFVRTLRPRLTGETYKDYQWSVPVSKDEALRYFSKEAD